MHQLKFRLACRGLLAALLFPLAAAAGPGDPLGPDFLANTPGISDEAESLDIARNASGLTVAAWSGEVQGSPGYKMYVRRFAANGAPLGTEQAIQVNNSGYPAFTVSAAVNDSGQAVVAWTEGFGNFQVRLQRFNATGQPVGMPIPIGDASARVSIEEPAVAMAANGSYTVVWRRYVRQFIPDVPLLVGPGTPLLSFPSTSIMAQRYDANGVAIGAAIRVASVVQVSVPLLTTGLLRSLSAPAVAMRGDGQLLVTWSSMPHDQARDTAPWQARLQRVGADGKLQGSATLVGESTNIRTTAVGLDAQGNAVVMWDQDAGDAEAIFLRRFDAAGKARSAAASAASQPGEIFAPSLAVRPDGSFVIAWVRSTGVFPNRNADIQARRFGTDGNPLAPEFLVNSTNAAGQQSVPEVAVDGLGNEAYLYRSRDAAVGVYARFYQAP